MMMNKNAIFLHFLSLLHVALTSIRTLMTQPYWHNQGLLLSCLSLSVSFFEFKYWNLYNKTIVTEPWGLSFEKLPISRRMPRNANMEAAPL